MSTEDLNRDGSYLKIPEYRLVLRADGLSFSYGKRSVLSGVSLSVAAGQVVTLLGPNGSGKSTLLKLLLHHLHPSAGTVHWFDREVRKWGSREFARRVAYLPQSPTAGPADTVLEAVRLGRSPHLSAMGLETGEDLRVVRETAELLSLSDLLDVPLSHLSGGQRQRVFLARCMAQQPAALVLDEPTTYLDLRHQLDLMKLMRKLATETGLAVVMSGHDLNLAGAFSDRVLVLEEGRTAGWGRPGEVLTPELLSRVYRTPMARLGSYVVPDLSGPTGSVAGQYRYAEPVVLSAGTKIEMDAAYDNSAGNASNPNSPPRLVRFGEQTTDEMGYCFLEVAAGDMKEFKKVRREAVMQQVMRGLIKQ